MEKGSCHQHCNYSRFCYAKGENRDDFPDECVNWYKIDDLLIEARYDREEATDEDDIPFSDNDYDGPDEEVEM